MGAGSFAQTGGYEGLTYCGLNWSRFVGAIKALRLVRLGLSAAPSDASVDVVWLGSIVSASVIELALVQADLLVHFDTGEVYAL